MTGEMSKRTNDDTLQENSKRSKIEGHVPECSSEDCLGCDIGEVEISFTSNTDDGQLEETQPTAQELLVMAIEESKEKQDDMARRLFDMALEKFKEEEPENHVGYACCLIELGKAINVEESAKEGLDLLKSEIKKNPESTELKLKLAYASMVLANGLRKQKAAIFATQEAALEQEDVDTEAYDELLAKQHVTKEEIKWYQEAIDYARDASKKATEENATSDLQTVINEFRTYSLSLDLDVQKEHASVVIQTTIDLIQQMPDYNNNWELITIWASCLAHQEKVLDKSHDRIQTIKKAIDMANKANELHVAKLSKEHPFMCELIAGLYMTQSGLTQDEDEAIDLYDQAVKGFRRALELAPEKVELIEMLKVLGDINGDKDLGEDENDIDSDN
ncbi:hypothetical protein BY458DRAFT_544050 [Sporodiniella umbellata]|nr:hypothetical protein BY458DRAFT_544050 [Sporodiniella umbellata]